MSLPDPLIVDDRERGVFRVNRETMTSEYVRGVEQQLVFERSWLYLGHESELPDAGDYRRRVIAGRSIIFVRGADAEIRAFHNTCPHRGAIVCRHDQGTAKAFQCFYHAWTFNNEGRLTGVPGKDGYDGGGFDLAERSLKPVARLESYRGLYFISFWPAICSLYDYLAGAREFIDVMVDQSPTREMRVASGSHLYSMRANWKLLCENSIDGYHGMPTHQTYFEYVTEAGGLGSGAKKLYGRGYALGNGHGAVEYWSPWGRPVARWVPQMGEQARVEIERIKADLTERHGRERAERISEWNRNLLIYPNTVINDIMAVTVRTFYPVRADFMEINAWALAPVQESGARLQTRLHNFLEFLGPGGFATPDDVEALESCQIGFNAGGERYNDVSRGMLRPAQVEDELQIRAFWRQWAAQIEGREIDDWDDGPPRLEAPHAPPAPAREPAAVA
ncbi:MAG: aromatic ring-hydroxylating oxygenase subunit alpha [Solirubrobacteraceae bacterium]